jgi:uncharacterized membrane protein YqjE
MITTEDPRPLNAVLHSLVGNVEQLVKAEISLAKVEVKEIAKNTEQAAVRLFVGVALLQLAAGFLLLAIVYFLSTRMSPWAAAAIVAVVMGLIAAVFLGAGANKIKHVKPEHESHAGSLVPHGGLHHG